MAGSVDTVYTYDILGRATQIDAATIEHDAAGNLERDRQGYWYQYDYENRIVRIYKLQEQTEVTVATFEYDALGRRIRKVDAVAAVTTLYYYDPDWRCLEERDGSDVLQRSFIYGNYIDEVLVMTVPGSPPADYYYLHDHLYSPVALLAVNGTVVERYEYDAYGHAHSWLDAGPDQVWFTGDDTMVDGGASNVGNPYFFTGRRLDRLDNGAREVMYYRHRSYGPFVGRFLQHDPLGHLDSLNLYGYVLEMPVWCVDPLGLYSYSPFPGEPPLIGGPGDDPEAWCKLCENLITGVTGGHLEEAFLNFAGIRGNDPEELSDDEMKEFYDEYQLYDTVIKPYVEECRHSQWYTRKRTGELEGSYYIAPGADANGWRGTLNNVDYTIWTQCRCMEKKVLIWHFRFRDEWDFNNLKGANWKKIAVDEGVRNLIVMAINMVEKIARCNWKPFTYKGEMSGAVVVSE